MIRHGAIGVDKEFVEDRFCSKKFQDPGDTHGVGENRSAVVAAHGDEEPLSTYVFFGWQAVMDATEVGFRHGGMFLRTVRWMFPRVALADMTRHPQSARLKDGRYNGLQALRFSIVSQLVTLWCPSLWSLQGWRFLFKSQLITSLHAIKGI